MEVPDFYGAATCVACPPFCPSLSTGKQAKETASTPVAWCQHQTCVTTPVQEDVLWVSAHQAHIHCRWRVTLLWEGWRGKWGGVSRTVPYSSSR